MNRCSAWQAALSVVCALLATDLSAQDSKPRHPDHEDIVFACRPQRDLTLDVYLPASTTNPPLVIYIHGTKDNVVLPAQSECMAAAYREARRPVELRLKPGARHKMDDFSAPEDRTALRTFLAKHLAP